MCYLIYLVLLFLVAQEYVYNKNLDKETRNVFSVRTVYDTDYSPLEFVFWVCNLSFIMTEIVAFYRDGAEYWLDSVNYIDLMVAFFYFILLALRIAGGFIGCQAPECYNEEIGPSSKNNVTIVLNPVTDDFTCPSSDWVKYDGCLNTDLSVAYFAAWWGLLLSICGRISYMLFVFYQLSLETIQNLIVFCVFFCVFFLCVVLCDFDSSKIIKK